MSEGKHLALLLPDMRGGGAERVAAALARHFVAAGHRVDLVLLQAEGELLQMLPPEVRIVPLGAKRLRSAFRPLVRYLRRERPDALQASMWPLTVLAVLAHRLAGSRARLVLSDHTILSDQYRAFGRRSFAALKATVRLFYRRADARVAVSQATADDLARLSGLPPSAFDVIYNPLDLPRAPDAASVAGARAMWGSDGARILSVGSLKSEKNFPLLVRSFSRLAARQSASLVILGEGPLRAEIERVAAAAGVGDRVILPGFEAESAPYYAAADLFVLASDFEGFGNVLVEAMWAGLPIVTTDSGGPGEIVAGGAYGTLVPVGDEAALADAMAAALQMQPDPERLRNRAQALSGAGSADRYLQLMLAR